MSEKEKHIELEVEATLALLDQETPVSIPEGFHERLIERLHEEPEEKKSVGEWKRGLQVAAMIAAIAVNAWMYFSVDGSSDEEDNIGSILSEYGMSESQKIW